MENNPYGDLLHLLKGKRATLQKEFSARDSEKGSKLPLEEFVGVLVQLQLPPSLAELRAFAEQLEQCHEDQVNYVDFLTMLENSGKNLEDIAGEAMFQTYGSVHNAFQAWDRNSDGVLTYDEFRNGMQSLRLGITDMQLIYLARLADSNENRTIEGCEFRKLFSKWEEQTQQEQRMKNRLNTQNPASLFRVLDKDNDGKLTLAEFSEMETIVPGVFADEDHRNRFFKNLDGDRDGMITYREYLHAFDSESSKGINELVGDVLHERYGSLLKAFKVYNTSGDGRITEGNFRWRCRHLVFEMTENEVTQLWKYAAPARNLMDLRTFCWLFSPPQTQTTIGDLIVRHCILSQISTPAAAWLALAHNSTAALTPSQLTAQICQIFSPIDSSNGEIITSQFVNNLESDGAYVSRLSFCNALEDSGDGRADAALDIIIAILSKYRSLQAAYKSFEKKVCDKNNFAMMLTSVGRSLTEATTITKNLENNQCLPLSEAAFVKFTSIVKHLPPKAQIFEESTDHEISPDRAFSKPFQRRRFSSLDKSFKPSSPGLSLSTNEVASTPPPALPPRIDTSVSPTQPKSGDQSVSPLPPRRPLATPNRPNNRPTTSSVNVRRRSFVGSSGNGATPITTPPTPDIDMKNPQPEVMQLGQAVSNALMAQFPSLLDAFLALDMNGDGWLSISEIEKGLQLAQIDLPKKKVLELASRMDKNGDNRVSFVEFCRELEGTSSSQSITKPIATPKSWQRAMSLEIDVVEQESQRMTDIRRTLLGRHQTLQRAFDALDINSDGRLSVSELQRGLNLSAEEAAAAHQRMDIDKDGYVDRKEFDYALLQKTGGGKRAIISRTVTKKEVLQLKEVVSVVISDKFPSAKAAFRAFDTNGDGKISLLELRAGLKLAGIGLSEQQVVNLLQLADLDRNNVIDCKEFIAAFQRPNGPLPLAVEASPSLSPVPMKAKCDLVTKKLKDYYGNLFGAFRLMDGSGKGYLTFKELTAGIRTLDVGLTEAELRYLVYEADVDKDGKVNYKDFIAAFSEQDSEVSPALSRRSSLWQL